MKILTTEPNLIGIPLERLANQPQDIADSFVADILTHGASVEREYFMQTQVMQYLLYGDYDRLGTKSNIHFPLEEEMYVDVVCMKAIFNKTIEVYNLIIDGYTSASTDIEAMPTDRGVLDFIAKVFTNKLEDKVRDLKYTVDQLTLMANLMDEWCKNFLDIFFSKQ